VARLPLAERPAQTETAPAAPPAPGGGEVPDAPALQAPARFEAAMGAYLRSLEESDGAAGPSAADRHALRKRKRAAWFEARRGPA
jgi:hypothetical protein